MSTSFLMLLMLLLFQNAPFWVQEIYKKHERKRKLEHMKEPQMADNFPRETTLTQLTLKHVANTWKARYTVADHNIFMLLAVGIPHKKFDHPLFRKWFAKYTTDIDGCIPTLSSNFPKVNVIRVNDSM